MFDRKHLLTFVGGVVLGAAFSYLINLNHLTSVDSGATAIPQPVANSPPRNSGSSLSKDGAEKVPGEKMVTDCLGLSSAPAAPCPCLFSDEILLPPHFAVDLPNPLQTNFEGEVRVRWDPVPGAKRYFITVEDLAGKIINLAKTNRSFIFLKGITLPPGKTEASYRIRVASANGKDEIGKYGEARDVTIKPQATIVAPEVQEIRVED